MNIITHSTLREIQDFMKDNNDYQKELKEKIILIEDHLARIEEFLKKATQEVHE